MLTIARRRVFPRLQKRGPIEAPATYPKTSRYSPFPRLQKRGPIEATSATTTHAGFGRFHAYKSVAPLKLDNFRCVVVDLVEFPRLQKRGPIEAIPIGRPS